MQTKRKVPFITAQGFLLIWLIVLLLVPSIGRATISFEDVSKESGIYHLFSTAASAWGDLNGDGWPDLWVSNHWHQRPSLYLNKQDGTFVDVYSEILVGDLVADFHGAAWADFDNDGDQDLIVLTGGGAGLGKCPNYLFVNQNGKLIDSAKKFGVSYPLGRGRTPLWLDADHDGKLDLLVMNRMRPGGKAPTSIFLNTKQEFRASNQAFGFKPLGTRSRGERLLDFFDNAIHFRPRKGPGAITPIEVFAQLTDLTGDHGVDLISYLKPFRSYSTASVPFKENTNDIGFPYLGAVQDVAIEDMNGDGLMDMYLTRSYPGQNISSLDSNTLQGRVTVGSDEEFITLRFKSKGDLTLKIFTIWIDPSSTQQKTDSIRLGMNTRVPIDGKSILLSASDPSLHYAHGLPSSREVSIGYDPNREIWQLHTALPIINFSISSTEAIEKVETIGLNSTNVQIEDYLLLKTSNDSKLGFSAAVVDDISGSASKSVVAGDFDNDMDMDIYLVCASPSQNLPNRLYENDGLGKLTIVKGAGGAAGSLQGKGNQVVSADYNRDGFLDLFVTNGDGQPPVAFDGPHQLFRNNGNENHWLEIDLQGTKSNRDGIGTKVELEAGGVKQVRFQGGGMHSFSQNHQRIHFGLGQNTLVDRITIWWPSGIVQELNNISADQIMKIVEDAPVSNGVDN
jgi:hypothetical protein